jgi:hypothetical protein
MDIVFTAFFTRHEGDTVRGVIETSSIVLLLSSSLSLTEQKCEVATGRANHAPSLQNDLS